MKKLKLLVVEDDPQSLYMLQFLLRERGHHVETAANGVEALDKARREPPDMAISDILMPQMDGFTLCREWKKDQQLKGIPFVFYSATYTDPKDEEFALSLGAERFITKPTESEAFLEILQDVIKEHEEGVLASPKEPVAEEADVLQQYSERLVKKLEDKMLQLEEANVELRAREEALRLEHDNLTNILGAMEDGVYIVNQQYDIQYVNPVLMKDFGPFEGRKCYEYFHDRTEVCAWCKNQAVLAGETVRWEWYSSKNQRTYDLIDTPLRNPDGSMSKLEIFRDITERKRTEEALRESEERYRQLFEGITDAVVVYSSEGGFLDCNEAMLQRLGYSREEFLRLVPADIVHADFHALVKDNQQRIWAGEITTVESAHRCKDGRVIPVEVNAQRIEYRGELAILAVVRDTTERKLAEAALRESEQRYRGLFENSPIALWGQDASEVKKYIENLRRSGIADFKEYFERHPQAVRECASLVKIIDVNQTALDLYEADNKEELLQGLEHVFTEESYDVFKEELIAIAEGNTLFEAETTGRTLTREERDIALRWTVVPGCEDTLSSVVVSDIDITERKRAEEEIRRRAEELAVLNEIGQAMSSALKLDELLQVIYVQTTRLMDTGNFYIAWYDEEQDLISFAFAVEEGERTEGPVRRAGRGLTEYVVRSRKPLLLERDVGEWIAGEEDVELVGKVARSWLGVPLVSGEKVLGVIAVQSYEADDLYDSGHLEVLSTIANQAAIAIENARLYEEVQARTMYLETLQRINATLRSTLPLQEVLNEIAHGTAEALGYVGAAIAVPDATGERLVLGAVSGGKIVDSALRLTGARLEALSVPLNAKDNLLVRAFLTGELQSSSGEPEGMSVGVQPSISPKVAGAIERAIGARSAVGVPLVAGEAIVGVLIAMSPRTRLSDEEQSMLLGVADQAGLAIENAGLHEEMQARSKYLETLQQINATLRTTLPINEVLGTIVRGATEAFGYAGSVITVPDEHGERLVFGAAWGGRFLDASMKLTGFKLEAYGLPLKFEENPMVQAFLTGEVQVSGKEPARIVMGVEPSISPRVAPVIARAMGAQSAACVPLQVGEKRVGVLAVMSPREGYADDELAMLTGLASQAGLAIENARLYEDTQHRAQELGALYDVSLEVAGELDLPSLLEVITSRAMDLLGQHGAGLYLYYPDSQDLEMVVRQGATVGQEGFRLNLGEGACGRAALTGEPLVVTDYANWEGRPAQLESGPTFNTLAVPIKRGANLLGALFVNNLDLESTFDDGDIRLATLFANQAAIAIENAQLLGETTQHKKDLQKLSSRLIGAQEEERKRISQELHDQMGQALTAMSINLAAIEQELGADLDPMTRERLAETDSLVDEALDQVRDLSLELRPSMLDDLGLLSALRWYVDRYTTRADVEVEFEAVALEERLHPDLETVLYRVVQESLTNVARHAQAGRVQVHLERKESAVTALIEDDGVGFSIEEVRSREVDERGAGLLGIRERVSSVQGSLTIESAPGEGTRLTIEIPLK